MQLSAIRSIILCTLLTSGWAQRAPCGPSPEIRSQLEKITVIVANPSDFDQALAPLVVLRQRDPNNLWVNERYQDAVQQYGIEGHLRKLIEDYQVLSMQHPDDTMYSYLYARIQMGRNTPAATRQLTEIVTDHPDFAPAHGALAEIYASAIFHNESKEKNERERFLALCPAAEVRQRPAGLPAPSPLIDQAENLRDDEWRLQRIRPFDWYSVDYKTQAQRDLQANYWRLWSLQVRCYRRASRPEKATALLAVMDQRTKALHSSSEPTYWGALAPCSHVCMKKGIRKIWLR